MNPHVYLEQKHETENKKALHSRNKNTILYLIRFKFKHTYSLIQAPVSNLSMPFVLSLCANYPRPPQSLQEKALFYDTRRRKGRKTMQKKRRVKKGDGQKRSFREHGVNELPGMTQASNEAWIENIRRTSSDRDASGNGFIEVSALIHQSIIRKKQ